MLFKPLFQFFFAIAYIIVLCTFVYKITLPLIFKIIDLCFESPRWRIGMCFSLAAMFGAVGIMQFNDYMEGLNLGLSRFFPLSFVSMGILLFLGFLHWKKI